MSPADRPPTTTLGPPLPGRADPVGRERREFISLMASRVARRAAAQAVLRRRRHRPRQPLPRSSPSTAGPGRWSATATASASSPPPTCATRCCVGVPPEQLPVRDVAIFEPLSVSADAELFDALILMLRHGFHRVIVRDGDEIVGVLTQLDLMAFVANHSQLIALEAEQAATRRRARRGGASDRRDDPRAQRRRRARSRSSPASSAGSTAGSSSGSGRSLAPEELRANSCLVVMGSEGRGEQIVKTDQDNALILRDGFAFDGLEAVTAGLHRRADRVRLSALSRRHHAEPAALVPAARRLPRRAARLDPRQRPRRPDEPRDLPRRRRGGRRRAPPRRGAAPISGDCSPAAMPSTPASPPPSSSSAARAAGGAACPACAAREAAEIDLKKLGIFPLVHGVRTLALQYGVEALGTVDRLRGALGCRPDRRRRSPATSWTRCTA